MGARFRVDSHSVVSGKLADAVERVASKRAASTAPC